MKTILMSIGVFMMALQFGQAQSNAEEVDFLQSIIGGEKKAVVADFIELEGASKDAFWELYDAYETERKVLGKKRISLLEKYAKEFEGISDMETDNIVLEAQKLAKGNEKLINSYYKKIKKASGSKAAAQFYHLENYFHALTRTTILENIPVIGELD
ncbi:hypothetical protein [Robiginitalea aurantiaca]|uniref:Uncharacterized protein n=1 Tax=Robiginitalea aurantiaca TaxID=3056915 RepID=A0ABT7WCL8_9FLAO|nr:hypothetical protein [Robiginitalea aurantiaca]MDM9630666.1 hypothetical protein [Robiginitalea aurantiaca]